MDKLPTLRKRLQQVCSKSQKMRFFNWILNEGDTCASEIFSSEAVNQFPALFRRCKRTNVERARTWWKSRAPFLEALES